MSFSTRFGLLRSLVIYYLPHRRRAWKSFYSNLLAPGDLAFDIGAHVGSRSRTLHALEVRVVAIEPQALFAKFLRSSLPSDIEVLQVAVGAQNTSGLLKTSSLHPTVSTLQERFVEVAGTKKGFESVQWDSDELVRVLTLDQLILDFGTPDYIKIDVEGYELEVLQGLSTPVSLISFEYLPGFKAESKAVIARIESLGSYEFNVVSGENAAFVMSAWSDGKTLNNWIDSLDEDSKSGDIFARQIAS